LHLDVVRLIQIVDFFCGYDIIGYNQKLRGIEFMAWDSDFKERKMTCGHCKKDIIRYGSGYMGTFTCPECEGTVGLNGQALLPPEEWENEGDEDY